MNRIETLRGVLFLRNLPDEALTRLAAAGEELALLKGQALFAEHDRCRGLLVVLTGAVKVYKLDDQGRELTLGVEKPGASVSELPLFDGGNYPSSAEAATDDTRVLLIPVQRFRAIADDYPEIAGQALLALGVRMRRLIDLVEAQALHTVQERLAAYLLSIAEGGTAFHLVETNDEIASQVGTVREVVSRTLRALKYSGVITLRGRWVTIEDIAALRRTAGRREEK